jgi:purine-binding chemotaxis protein CheW
MPNISEESTQVRQLVAFHLGGEQYALPIEQIQEVIRYTEPRAVASEDPWVIGVISLRGKIVPVADLASRLGISATHSEDSKVVIVETAGHTFGLIVDAVDEVLSIDEQQIDTNFSSADFVRGIAKLEQRLIVILDAATLAGNVPAAA